jgi:hypothetical protein
MTDPIIDEIHRYRREHAEEFGGDLGRICQDLRRFQQESGIDVVRRRPRLLNPRSDDAMREAFDLLSHSYDTSQADLAARHEESNRG